MVEYAADNSSWIDFGLIFGLASLLLLGWFVGGLYVRLRRLGADVESVLALIGGVTFTLLSFLAIMLWYGFIAEAASAAALRTGWVPAWAGWIGIALGVISLATAALFGIIAWFLWIVLASALMLVRSLREPRAFA